MIELIKQAFDFYARMNWLKTINKEVEKYNKLKKDLDIQAYIINKMVGRYKEIYGDDLRNHMKEAGG